MQDDYLFFNSGCRSHAEADFLSRCAYLIAQALEAGLFEEAEAADNEGEDLSTVCKKM